MTRTTSPRGQVSVVLIAILVLILIAIAFYIGHAYSQRGNAATSTPSTATTTAGEPGVSVDSSWLTDQLPAAGFSISYPPIAASSVSDVSTTSQDWQTSSQTLGTLAFMLDVPSSFEPQTNFGDAKLTVGYATTSAAVADCDTPLMSGGPQQATTSATIGGVIYMVTQGSDAGAGNRYDTTSYRTVHDGSCYSIDYTIHYSEIENYPPSAGISNFDEAKVQELMNNIVGTFTFTS